MSYSITPILHPNKDKDGLQKIQIRIIYNRVKTYLKTDFKVSADQFKEGVIVKHTNAIKINALIRKQITDAESVLIDSMREGVEVKSLFKKREATSVYLHDYFTDLVKRLKGKNSPMTLRHYTATANKVFTLYPKATFADVTPAFLEKVEASMRGKLDPNTINGNMKRLKSMISRAAEEGLIDPEQFRKYKPPLYRQKLVEYLSEKEINSFAKVVKSISKPTHKLAGYYFLLSCYTGWRISDVKRFNPSLINGNTLSIRSKKNGSIVSIKIYTRLKEVLKFCAKRPFDLSEQKAREYVKEIAVLAGIKKDVKFHTGRHSFAMLLMANGFTIDEVAELIGDSTLIAKIYAKVHNETLNKKIMEKLG